MLTLRGARLGLAVVLLTTGLLRAALAAEIRLTDVTALEDPKGVKLRFTFSDAVKPDVTYFYTHNYVGLRASGLQFTAAQLKRDVPPPSEDAARAYRFVRFVQDKESAEIRLYLTKPLTPADAQVVPYDTYTEVTLLKPAGSSKPLTPVTEGNAGESLATETATETESPANEVAETEPVETSNIVSADETPPTLRNGSPVAQENTEPATTHENPVQPAETIKEELEPLDSEREPESEPAPASQPQTTPRIGGPSYVDFDLEKVPVNQLVFKGRPFREALTELVAGTGYNVVVSDDVDNSEVSLNFNQKQLSLKSALDLLALAFDLQWSLQPDAIVIKAKPPQ